MVWEDGGGNAPSYPILWDRAMKGPGNRRKFVIRRLWECPRCGRVYWAGTHWARMREVLAGL